jgi:hypothetical protein
LSTRVGHSLLKEVCRHATGVAAAMLCIRTVTVSATVGSDVIAHTYQPIGMMMMGNYRNNQ